MLKQGDIAKSTVTVLAFEKTERGFYLCDILVSKGDVVVFVNFEDYLDDVKMISDTDKLFCKILTKRGIVWFYKHELRKIL